MLNDEEQETLDKHHSHLLLMDNGEVGQYDTDRPRSDFIDALCKQFQCLALTIIVEGGIFTLEVIKNDIDRGRPVIIVHRSGRLANLLGSLLEITPIGSKPEYTDTFDLRSCTHGTSHCCFV